MRRVALFTVGIAGLLSLAGCGGGGGDSTTTQAARTWSVTVANNLQGTARPKLSGPSIVTPGKSVTLHGSEYPPGMKVTFTVLPAAYLHANGVGIVIRRTTNVSAEGRFSMSFVFPNSYCGGAPGCTRYPFQDGKRVALAAGTLVAGGSARILATVQR